MKTLPHLLWSDLQGNPDGNGPIIPGLLPALGLPYRVAAFLLAEALFHRRVEPELSVDLPRVWVIQGNMWPVAAEGRNSQFDLTPTIRIGQTSLRFSETEPKLLAVLPATEWPIRPHAAYFLTDTVAGCTSEFITAWHDALSFIAAVDGSEHLLDRMWESAPSSIPFDERWALRSQIPMPPEIWLWLEEMARVARTGQSNESDWQEKMANVLQELRREFDEQLLILPDEFLAERCDVSLATVSSPEFPCAVERREVSPRQAVSHVPVIEEGLATSITVRIAQLTTQPLDVWNGFPERFPHLRRRESQRVFRQVTQAFQNQGDGSAWEIAVFPELCLPFDGRQRFEGLVAEAHKAGVIGCLWREVGPGVARLSRTIPTRRFFVNEALLSVSLPCSTNRMRPIVRSFLVRKPLPAHVEIALACRLSELSPGVDWRMLPGRRVFRFVHANWGDFTVAICSDLLDPAPWLSMRGNLLHIFLCSYNKDVALFESLTWIRGYENFANMIATNCGAYGGSFAWSPRSGDNKEIARIRGNDLFVLADVSLPVRELFAWQRIGKNESINSHLEKWRVATEQQSSGFKSPPPSFPSRQ